MLANCDRFQNVRSQEVRTSQTCSTANLEVERKSRM
eukprot:gene20083-7158_t